MIGASCSLRRARARIANAGAVEIDRSARIEDGARIEVARGGRLLIGARCRVEAHARLFVRSGTLEIGAETILRERASIVAIERVTLGERVDVGERAAIVDLMPSVDDVERPLRDQQVLALGIDIGSDVTIGPSAAIETGARIPAKSAIAAGATVSKLGERATIAPMTTPTDPTARREEGPAARLEAASAARREEDPAARLEADSARRDGDPTARREQVVREIFAAFARRDASAELSLLSPSIVLETVSGQVVNDGRPYVGHEGIARYFADVDAHWRKLQVQPQQIRAAGRAVVAIGLASGVSPRGELRDAPTTWVFKFDGELVRHIQIFSDPQLARSALGGER